MSGILALGDPHYLNINMDRRTFITISSVGAAMVVVPYIIGCNSSEWLSTLAVPQTLGQFCAREELMDVGKSYCDNFPNEANRSSLEELILDGHHPQSQESLLAFINQKIGMEFAANKIAFTKGWVLSKTEARQAALYYLVNA